MGKPAQVVQAAAWYPPFQVGGTEVYVAALVDELKRCGFESAVLVPRHPQAGETYEHAGTRVETYPVNEAPRADELAEGAAHDGFDVFRERLGRHRGAIYHQHSWTRGCGLNHLAAAHALGMRCVVTVHVPDNICLRGTMRRFGDMSCDGRIEPATCGACWAQSRGMPRVAAEAVSRMPAALAHGARRLGGRVGHAVAARALAEAKADQLSRMIAMADRVVAVCGWVRDALLVNGAPAEKVVLSRQGIARDFEADVLAARGARTVARVRNDATLRLVYLGTFSPVKGIEHVITAVRTLPADLEVRLTIHGAAGNAERRAYEARLRALAEGEPRIVFAGPLERSAVAGALVEHDVLVVPSVWLETGPIVVLEAQAAGLYVLGSNLGGIAELVGGRSGGELVEAGNAGAWTAAIARLARSFERTAGGKPSEAVRTMRGAAADMMEIYGAL